MICSSTKFNFFFSSKHYGVFDVNEMNYGFLLLNVVKTLWIYFLALGDVNSAGSLEIFQTVISSMQLIENVMTQRSPSYSNLAGFGGAPVFGSLGLQ